MRKYLYIFKSQLMTNLNYMTNILFGFLGYFIMLYIFINLWNYLYSDPSQLINGYNVSQMIWYVIITELIWSSLGGRKICNKVSEDVKGGNIAYNLNKPYSYVGYILSTHLGDVIVKFVMYFVLAFIVGLLFVGNVPSFNILQFIVILFTSLLAIIISIFLISCVALLSFFIEDSGPLYWLYSKVILIFGTVFPIEFFGGFISKILSFSPIFVVSYGPARLFVNFSYKDALTIIIAQGIYLLITYLLCEFIYRRGVKKLNVNGG